MLRRLLVALALSAAASPALAQSGPPPVSPAPPSASAVSTARTASPAAAGDSAAAAGADTMPVAVPKPTAQALAYHRSGNVLWVVDTLWSLLIPLLLLVTGLSARIRSFAWRVGRKWYFALAIYGAVVTVLLTVVSLPLGYYEGFVREHAYGLSNQTFGKWAVDTVIAFVLAVPSFALVMWLPYLLLRKSPRRWWLWTALGAIPLIVATIFIQPLLIDPLFNKFGPMHDRALERQILAEAARAGITGGRVFEVNKSVDTKELNAYVNGFGGSKRIVLWDTTLRRMTPREILFVLGHEMGHYVLRHMLILIAAAAALILASLWLVHVSAGAVLRRWGARFGFERLDDFASYPLLMVIVSVASLVVAPLQLALTRHLEHEADRFGLELTRDNHAAATAFVKLQGENLSVPYHSTLYKLWHDSHPPVGERIEFANTYKPWAHGQPLKYGDHFKAPPSPSSPTPAP
jgi:Zn-dependent protease with chaperone function